MCNTEKQWYFYKAAGDTGQIDGLVPLCDNKVVPFSPAKGKDLEYCGELKAAQGSLFLLKVDHLLPSTRSHFRVRIAPQINCCDVRPSFFEQPDISSTDIGERSLVVM